MRYVRFSLHETSGLGPDRQYATCGCSRSHAGESGSRPLPPAIERCSRKSHLLVSFDDVRRLCSLPNNPRKGRARRRDRALASADNLSPLRRASRRPSGDCHAICRNPRRRACRRWISCWATRWSRPSTRAFAPSETARRRHWNNGEFSTRRLGSSQWPSKARPLFFSLGPCDGLQAGMAERCATRRPDPPMKSRPWPGASTST